MHDAVIVSAVRTAAGKAPTGTLRGTRPDELAAAVIGEALRRAPGLDPAEIDDVILGCAMPEGEQGLNIARVAGVLGGLPVETSAQTINHEAWFRLDFFLICPLLSRRPSGRRVSPRLSLASAV